MELGLRTEEYEKTVCALEIVTESSSLLSKDK